MSECCDYLKLHRIIIFLTESKGQEVLIKKKNISKKTLSIWSIYVYNFFVSFELLFWVLMKVQNIFHIQYN